MAQRARGWCIAVSFACERLRNIIALTLDFYFLWIIPFSLPFAGAYFILQHNWGILIPPTLPASLNYDLLLKWNMKIGEMPPGNVLTRVHCNQTAWQAVISKHHKRLKFIYFFIRLRLLKSARLDSDSRRVVRSKHDNRWMMTFHSAAILSHRSKLNGLHN